MDLKVGNAALCDIIKDRKPTGQRVPVQILELRRGHNGMAVQSVRVKTTDSGPKKFIWVKAEFIHPV